MNPRMHRAVRFAALLAMTISTGAASIGAAWAIPPRSERVAARIAERAYARQSIAEARAARAEARVAEIAPLVPVPPPPRPATVRRMARAGVPLVGQPPLVRQPPLVIQLPPTGSAGTAVVAAPSPGALQAAEASPARTTASIPAAADPAVTPAAVGDVAEDGTRSVLTTVDEAAPTDVPREAAGPAVTHPPIELLPTPQPQ